MDWSWLNQNSGGVQAIMAIVVGILTVALIAINIWYGILTHRTAVTMQRQLAATFQPNIQLGLNSRFHGSGREHGRDVRENVSGTVIVKNNGTAAVRIVSVTMTVAFDDPKIKPQAHTFATDGRVVMPGQQVIFPYLTVDVPLGSTAGEYEQRVDVLCADLARINEATVSLSSRDDSIQ